MPPSECAQVVLKICGLTRVADMRGAEAAGADYCGCIVGIERSPRSLTRGQAVLLARACRAQPVLVIEDIPVEEVVELAEAARPAAMQVHGDAGPEYIGKLAEGLRGRAQIWRSVGLPVEVADRDAALAEALAEIVGCQQAGTSAIVLDTRTAEGTGGSGRTCDWQAAAAIIGHCELPVILAGGLAPENLREAIETTSPAGVDLSSSLESEPGRKDPARLKELAAVWAQVR